MCVTAADCPLLAATNTRTSFTIYTRALGTDVTPDTRFESANWGHPPLPLSLPPSLLFFSVEMSGHDMVCFDKTFEAAEALLHMESPGLHNDRNAGKMPTKVLEKSWTFVIFTCSFTSSLK